MYLCLWRMPLLDKLYGNVTMSVENVPTRHAVLQCHYCHYCRLRTDLDKLYGNVTTYVENVPTRQAQWKCHCITGESAY